ncbi:MAG TPA: helix-turn-helix domain-containing protein [Paracoccaceae bacterium]|nr:helix-turn-helix domain-containing protein [Paracoccaceae bacterium]
MATDKPEKYDVGDAIIAGLRDVLAAQRGEIELTTATYPSPMPKERIRAIRRKAARSAKAFAERFGIPKPTIDNWEQGRTRPDPAAQLLLTIIETDPEMVERAAKSLSPRIKSGAGSA